MRSCEELGETWHLPYGENKEMLETVAQAVDEAGISSVWTGIRLTKYSSFYWENGVLVTEHGKVAH